MIASIVWAAVALITVVAIYDIATKAIKAWSPKEPMTTGLMLDNTIFAAQIRNLQNDMNALKVAAGFKKALGEKADVK